MDPDLADTGETEEQMRAREVVWDGLYCVWRKMWSQHNQVWLKLGCHILWDEHGCKRGYIWCL